MCTVGENCCPPTKNRFTNSAEGASNNPLAGRVCCSKEDCSAPGIHEAAPFDQMEFWGTEVTPGKGQLNEPGEETYIHVSQAALGPGKEGKSERVVIRVESGGKNFVLGTLAAGKVDQMTLDLIFDREFKLSHTGTSSSVFFCGYRTDKGQGDGDVFDDEEDEDEDEESDEEDDEPVPTAVTIKQNGTVSAKEGAKVIRKETKVIEQVVEKKAKKADALKPILLQNEAEEGEESDDDDDEDADKAMKVDFDADDYDEEDDSEFEVDDEDGSEEEDEEDEDSDEEDDSDEDEDDEDDVAAELGKKRSLKGSAKKSPGEGKKPRLDTPAKPGSQTAAEYWESLIIAGRKGLISTPGKKGPKGAVDTKSTPESTKKSEAKGVPGKTPQKTPGKEGKTPKSEKSTPTTPASGESAKKIGAHYCAECKRNFATESALSQHAVAKHKK